MATLGPALSTRDNALNFVRLLLAITVIVAHTWPLGGYGVEPTVGDSNIGHLAVAGFFAISGYLITISRMRLPLGQFMMNRAVRILPGFWVCLIVVAFLIAPVMNVLAGTGWSIGSAAGYVVKNAGLFIFQMGIADGPLGVPFEHAWNGSLWTLSYEFAAYLATAALFTIPAARRRPGVAAAIVLVTTVGGQIVAPTLLASVSTNLYRNLVMNALWLGAFYAAGVLFAAIRDRVPVSLPVAIVAAALFVVAVMTHTVTTLGALPLAYIVLWLGAALRVRVGASNDFSYGVYIYAFPVQQALAAIGVGAAVPFAVFVVIALGVTIGLAWASWALVERPSLTASRRLVQARRVSLPETG